MKLDERTIECLDRVREKVKRNEASLTLQDKLDIGQVYHAITGNVLSTSCEKCYYSAYKTLNNYMDYHEPKGDLEPVNDPSGPTSSGQQKYAREVKLGEGTPIQKPKRIIMLGALGFGYAKEEKDGKRSIAYVSTDTKTIVEHDELMEMTDEVFDEMVNSQLWDLLKNGRVLKVAQFEYRFYNGFISPETNECLRLFADENGFDQYGFTDMKPEKGDLIHILFGNGEIVEHEMAEDSYQPGDGLQPIYWKIVRTKADYLPATMGETDNTESTTNTLELNGEESGKVEIVITGPVVGIEQSSIDESENRLDEIQTEFDNGPHTVKYADLLLLAKSRYGFTGARIAGDALVDFILAASVKK